MRITPVCVKKAPRLRGPALLGDEWERSIVLDIDFIVDHQDEVRAAIRAKGVSLDLDELLGLLGQVKRLLQQTEELRHERNTVSKDTARASGKSREQLITRSRQVNEALKQVEPQLRDKQAELRSLLLLVPQIPGPDEPVGLTEEDNVVLSTWGEQPAFDFPALDHVELLELQGWADFHRVPKLAGSRSYGLVGDLALLEMALWWYAMNLMRQKGFTLMTIPSLAKEEAFFGTGHFPTGRIDVYHLPADDLYLSGTAEVGLNYLHSGEILSLDVLPICLAGFSPCFRREAGSAGRDVRGLIRVHQFGKVEQFVICRADRQESDIWFSRLLANAEEIVRSLELPYRVVRTCTGEMGAGKVRMWDIECWIPTQQRYLETHSVSEFHDWQSRRANLRYRDETGRVRSAYTLNNTAIATPRILVPLVEVHQKPDGTVRVPEPLRPYLGGVDCIGVPTR
jgi:seryl-tRNA synthetase